MQQAQDHLGEKNRFNLDRTFTAGMTEKFDLPKTIKQTDEKGGDNKTTDPS